MHGLIRIGLPKVHGWILIGLHKVPVGSVLAHLRFPMFHFQFLEPLSSISVGYKSESNNANDSKKEDLSQQLDI